MDTKTTHQSYFFEFSKKVYAVILFVCSLGSSFSRKLDWISPSITSLPAKHNKHHDKPEYASVS